MPRRFVRSTGDVNWFDEGGGLVFKESLGDYTLEVIIPPGDGLDHYEIYRVTLDPDWPNWANAEAIARTVDYPGGPLTLRADFRSNDLHRRIFAYEAIAAHDGWHSFDPEPLQLSRAEARKRYASLLRRKAKARYAV